jgi:hypothetical protein
MMLVPCQAAAPTQHRADDDHVAASLAFRAIELNEASIAAHSLPALERQILHASDADAAEDRATASMKSK